MYRPPNQPFPQTQPHNNKNMQNKMPIDHFNPSVPVYYDNMNNNQHFQYVNSHPNNQGNAGVFESNFNWRDGSQPKGMMMNMNNRMSNMNSNQANMPGASGISNNNNPLSNPNSSMSGINTMNMPNNFNPNHLGMNNFLNMPSFTNLPNMNNPNLPVYEPRQHQMFNGPPPKNNGQAFVAPVNVSFQPQFNVIQRITGIIKSQLTFIHSTMSFIDLKTKEQKRKKERSRSRSKSRQRRRRSRQRQHKQHKQWNCPKCSFLNFQFRDKCKRCNDSKPESRYQKNEPRGKGYVPNPDDWRCFRCENINYARRIECFRCHTPRNK